MSSNARGGNLSTVLVDESFASQDDAFLERLRQVSSTKYLAGLADRWKKDPRPWAREQIFAYLDQPMDRPGHHPLVKRLFKQAESNRDHELMGAFLVAFDRLIRRKRSTRFRYDPSSRQVHQEEELVAPANQILSEGIFEGGNDAGSGRFVPRPSSRRIPKMGRLFTYKTRHYLRRRVWRYFRRLAIQQPAEFPSTIASALLRYRDADVASGANILDNWSLMHIAFVGSPALKFFRSVVQVADDRSLADLMAAPAFEEIWKAPRSAGLLLMLAAHASARLVRVWAIQLLERLHQAALLEISAEQLSALLEHPDEQVQRFGAGLLATSPAVDHWPASAWLRLLETAKPAVLGVICEAMRRKVQSERLSLEQCIALSCARATPTAKLGLGWLRERKIVGDQDRATLVRMAAAQCDAVGAEAAQWALSILGDAGVYKTDAVAAFFDSANSEVRRGAWDWLTPNSQGYSDANLWSRLLETPYDDVRLRLVSSLQNRTSSPAQLRGQDLTHVWTTVLLGVHRGGRAKLHALRQISQAIADQPTRAESLMEVLAVAIRSVRPAEARAGLSAILAAVALRPPLEALLAERIPELRLSPRGATS
jgi:hypothetical protein